MYIYGNGTYIDFDLTIEIEVHADSSEMVDSSTSNTEITEDEIDKIDAGDVFFKINQGEYTSVPYKGKENSNYKYYTKDEPWKIDTTKDFVFSAVEQIEMVFATEEERSKWKIYCRANRGKGKISR